MDRRRALLFFLVLFFSVNTSAFAQAIAIDRVLVVVNEEPITLSEYDARYRREVLDRGLSFEGGGKINPQILELLIDERIQAQAAVNRGIRISDAEVEAAIESIARRNNLSVAGLETALTRDRIPPDQFRKSIRDQQLIRRLVDVAVNSRVQVSEQEVNHYLRTHRELIATDVTFELSHLFISTENKDQKQIQSDYENLQFIRTGLLTGQSFEKAVEDYADNDKKDGGYIGWRKQNQLPEIFVDALHPIQTGSVSEIIESDKGFHILKLHGKKGNQELVDQQLLRHILIQPSRKEMTEKEAIEYAQELITRLRNGEDFESLARLHSDDPRTINKGGLLGWVGPGELSPEFENTAKRMPINDISEPLRSPFGIHILQVLDKRRYDVSRSRAENQARQVLFERKSDTLYRNWFDALKSASYVEYLIDVNG